MKLLILFALLVGCGEVPRPGDLMGGGGSDGSGGSAGQIGQQDGDPVAPACNPPTESARVLCKDTLWRYCRALERCGLRQHVECIEEAVEICQNAREVRDRCALVARCWPWLDALSCELLAESDFRIIPSCRAQFLTSAT